MKLFIIIAIILMVAGSVTPYSGLFLTGLLVGLGTGIAYILKYMDGE